MDNLISVTQTPVWEVKVRTTLNNLRASEKKVALCVLENPQRAMELGISQLAERCGVSDATVVRFCRSLGYRGLKDLKIAIAQEQYRKSSPADTARELEKNDSAGALMQKVFSSCIEALHDTLELQDERTVEAAIDAIYHARFVDIFAEGGSAAIARCAEHSFRKIGVRLNVCSESVYMMAERFDKKDVALAISHSGETLAVLNSLIKAKDNGATIIVITGTQNSSMAKLSDICLLATSRARIMPSDDYTYERAAQLVLVNAIYGGVAMRLRAEHERRAKL